MEIETTNPAFRTKDHDIVKLVVAPITFAAFAAAGAKASQQADDKAVARVMFRERIKRQITAVTAKGDKIAMDDSLISAMPVPTALAVRDALNYLPALDDAPGKAEIISKGDGMLTPIHIKLGTPIAMQGGKTIPELEFLAKSFGELEDAIVSGEGKLAQTQALIQIATPVGPDMNMLSLPSWAVDQITLADGLFVMSEVAPHFFGSGDRW